TLGGTSLPASVVKFQLPTTSGEVTVVAPDPLWGQASLGPQGIAALINSGNLVVNITSSTDSLSTFSISDVSLNLLTSPFPGQNFNYVKTFEQTDGTTLTLALDALGNLYQEDVYNAPDELTSFYSNILPNTFASSVTVDDREFIVFSDLLQGTDMPRAYDGTNFNRLSQVGPGVPPTIAQVKSVANLTACGNAISGLTAYTGTFNPFIPVGILVSISGFTTPANNGQFYVVSCDATTLIVDNTAGVSESATALVTFSGSSNTIISITQPAAVSLSRVCVGGGMGNETGNGAVMTFFGQAGI